MNTIRLTTKNVSECAGKAAGVLRKGGIVVYPTDTLYGLGANAFSNEAVDKIRKLKGREEGKPIHCIVSDMTMAERFVTLNENAHVLAKNFLPGPLTLVLQKRPQFITGIARDIDTIGIRIPRSELCIAMTHVFDAPITTTSANVSGQTPENTVEKILAQFGDAANSIDLIIDAGELAQSRPSTVVDVSASQVAIVREGALSTNMIHEALRVQG